MRHVYTTMVAAALLAGITTTGQAAETGAAAPRAMSTSVAMNTPDRTPALSLATPDARPLVLSAPPRDTAESGHRIFDPVAAYLSAVMGRPVVYRYPATWGGYQADMQAGAYDLVFDGPHFNSWRAAHRQHTVLVKLPGEFVYTAIIRSDNKSISRLNQLAGHKICAHAPPNLGTLIMYSEFTNPVRQPVVIVKEGYKEIYQALLDGKCEAAMLPLAHVEKFEQGQGKTRIVFRTHGMPEQAFSAGPRLSAQERSRIADALLSPAAASALSAFSKAYGLNRGFVPASNGEYAGLDGYLKDQWGYQ